MSNLDSIFNPAALSAREQVTDWIVIKKVFGTKVGGKFLGWWNVPAQAQFKAQIGVAVSDIDDATKVYGVNLPEYFKAQVSEYQVGDLCGFEYYKDVPAKEKGLSPTKAVRAFNPDLQKRKLAGEAIKTTEPEAVHEDQVDINEIVQ